MTLLNELPTLGGLSAIAEGRGLTSRIRGFRIQHKATLPIAGSQTNAMGCTQSSAQAASS